MSSRWFNRLVLSSRGVALGSVLSLAACGGTGPATSPEQDALEAVQQREGTSGSSLRVLTYNTAFMKITFAPPVGTIDTNSGKYGGYDYKERATHIAEGILRADDDVVALNEVFSDDAKDMLVTLLAAKYPYFIYRIKGEAPNPWVKLALAIIPAGAGPAEPNDSGLMLFSKYPFVPFTVGTKPFYLVDEVEGGANGLPWGAPGEISVATFTEANDMDGLASKAVAMVRVKNPNDGQISNIAFTHLQASYSSQDSDGPATRAAQLKMARELILSSLTPSELSTQQLYLMGDLNVIGGNQADPGFDGEWKGTFANTGIAGGFFACGDGPCTFDPVTMKGETFLKDSWGFETSVKDPGISNNVDNARLDYILHNRSSRMPLCMQHITIAYELGQPTAGGLQQLSDHFGVQADFNRQAPHCSANDDAPGTLGPQPVSFGASADVSFTTPDARLAFPGSMQWYRIDKAGSYSIHVNPVTSDGVGRFAFTVYKASDLSQPIPPFYGEKTRWGDKFAMTEPPYYIRVFAVNPSTGAPDRTFAGDYTLSVHQHRGTSAYDSISLAGGFTTQFDWPGSGTPELPRYWFDFHTNTTSDGKFPKVSHFLEVPIAQDPSLYRLEIHDDAQNFPLIPAAGQSIVQNQNTLNKMVELDAPDLKGTAQGAPKKYFLTASRDSFIQNTGTASWVTFGTTLTYIRPSILKSYDMADDWPDRDNIELGFMYDGPYQKGSCNAACIGPIAFSTDSPVPLTGYSALNKTFIDNAVFNLWKEGDYLAPQFTSGGQSLGVGSLWMFETGFDTGGQFIWADGGNIDDADYWYVMNYGLSHDASKH